MDVCISERSSNLARRLGAAAAFLTLACIPAFAAPSKSTAQGKVTAVRFWSLGDVTRIAIEVSSEFKYRSERLTNPDRLFFDIQGAKPEMIAKGMHVIAVNDSLVKQIRVAETQPGVTRIVLDLVQSAAFTASQLSGPDRLMVEIRLKDSPAPPAVTSSSGSKLLTETPLHSVAPDFTAAPLPVSSPAAPVVTTVSAPAYKPEPRRFDPPPFRAETSKSEAKTELLKQPPVNPYARAPKDPLPPPNIKTLTASLHNNGPESSKPLASLSAITGTSAPAPTPIVTAPISGPRRDSAEPMPAKLPANGSSSLTRALGLKLGRVVIDPGHGGHDIGTHGPSGLNEKDVVLDVSLRLGKLLEERLSSEVVYTRADDTFIPLEERPRIANERKADLFLSIHANSSPYRTAAGVESYYLNFTTSRAAMDLAARENASSQRSVFDLKDLLQKIALKDKIDESREFANSIQRSLYGVSSKGNADAKNRGIKKAPFVVLIGASMPSVLAEIGFLTNATDEALLRKPEHRQKIAEALYKGIASYADSLSHFQVAKN